jgi:uncharacterized integral membrane protein (TIGR00697 family)
MGLFITVLILSNLLSSAKIIDVGQLGGFAFVFDAGTIVFPISYIFGDILTEIYGYQRSRRVIWMGFVSVSLLGFFVWLAGILPGEALWSQDVGQSAYDSILGGIPGLIVASLAAYLVGSFSNSYVLAKLKIRTQGRWLWTRTIGSTLVGQGMDTIVFISLATFLGVFPPEIFVSLIATNYVLKVGIEIMMTPITLTVVKFLKRIEKEDVFDYETNFNPFSVRL